MRDDGEEGCGGVETSMVAGQAVEVLWMGMIHSFPEDFGGPKD